MGIREQSLTIDQPFCRLKLYRDVHAKLQYDHAWFVVVLQLEVLKADGLACGELPRVRVQRPIARHSAYSNLVHGKSSRLHNY